MEKKEDLVQSKRGVSEEDIFEIITKEEKLNKYLDIKKIKKENLY